MLEASRAIIEAAEQSGDRVYIYAGLGYRAWAESRLGQHEAATESMTRSKAIARDLGPRLIVADWLAVANSEIALNAGRAEEVLALAEQALSVAKTVGSVFTQGLAHRVWGQGLFRLAAPRLDEAESHLTESLELLESGEAWLDAARTHLAWGELCQMRRDTTGARDHLEKAFSQFEKSGLSDRLARTRELIQQLR